MDRGSVSASCINVRQSLPWYVAQLKPNGFVKARQNLLRQGFQVFMPMREVTIRHARSECRSLRPMFLGYLFVSFDPNVTQWRCINSTFGVSRLISVRTDLPQAAPVALMREMFARCDEDDTVLPPEHLRQGDAVQILNGPFAGLLAEVDTMTDGDRVALLLEVMGRRTRAECARTDLEKY